MLVMSKHENICLPGNNSTLQSTSTHETSFFSWITVQKFYNLLPLGITPCKSIHEAKMYTPQEVVNSLLALDLPPTPSPKLKALFPQRVHKQGCPPEMRFAEQMTEAFHPLLIYHLKGKTKTFRIGMLSV